LSAVLVALLAALGPSYGGEITIEVPALPASLEPATAEDATQRLALGLVHETLVSLDEGGRMGPGLARAYRPGAGGREWLFEIEPDLRFHDDTPVTADDVARSLRRYLDGPDAAGRALREALAADGLLVPDARHVLLRFREPQAQGVPALASPAAAVLSASGAGAGPFLPTVRVPGQRLALTAFAGHVRGRPYLDRVTLVAQPDAARRAADVSGGRADAALDAGAAELPFATRLRLVLALDTTQELATSILAAAARADLPAFVEGAAPPAGAAHPPAASGGSIGPLRLVVANDVPPAASQRLVAVLEAAGAVVALEGLAPGTARAAAAPARLLLEVRPGNGAGITQTLALLPLRAAVRPAVHGLRWSGDARLVVEDAWTEP
jgi:hypothetical protein